WTFTRQIDSQRVSPCCYRTGDLVDGRTGRHTHCDNAVRRDRSRVSLQREVTDSFRLDSALDRTEDPLGHEDLPWLCLRGEPLCEIRHVTDRAVVIAALESDAPK